MEFLSEVSIRLQTRYLVFFLSRSAAMMIGAYLGVRLLKERYGIQRLAGSALIATGVVALALD